SDADVRPVGQHRLALLVQAVLGHAVHLGAASHAEVAVGRGEVAKDDGQLEDAIRSGARLGLRADVAGLLLAGAGAAVAIGGVAVVAVFVADDEAVAGARGAAFVGALRLGLAGQAAAIERHPVVLFAGLGAFLFAVAAHRFAAGAGRAVTCPADFELAGGRAAVVRVEGAVVALLREDQDAVTAFGEGTTWLTRIGADEARLDHTAPCDAAIAARLVAVVA